MSLQKTELKQNLSEQFGGTGRSAGLGSLFKAPGATNDQTEESMEVDQDEAPAGPEQGDRRDAGGVSETSERRGRDDAAPPVERRPRQRRTTGARTAKPSTSRRPDRLPQTTVYVTPQLKRRLEDYKHKHRCTTRDVVIKAIAATSKRWKEVIESSKYYVGEVNELFEPDESKKRYLGGGDAQIQFAPTPAQDEKLDEIGDELGFSTRSTWIAPMLNEYLPGKKETLPA